MVNALRSSKPAVYLKVALKMILDMEMENSFINVVVSTLESGKKGKNMVQEF